MKPDLPTLEPALIRSLLNFACELAQESGELIMQHWRKGVTADKKADGTPVTIADQQAEQLIRQRITKAYPQHAILGEEYGWSSSEDKDELNTSPLRWVIDPIDGTQAFARKVPLFGTLIALCLMEQPIVGVVNLPVSGELLAGAQGMHTTLNQVPTQVSKVALLSDATVLTTDFGLALRENHQAWQKLAEKGLLLRGWGDCYGHFMVATGRADIMIDPTINLWDIAAIQPCIEGAGGVFSDLQGNTQPQKSSAISSNKSLHNQLIPFL